MLIAIMADVLTTADSEHPEGVTQRHYNQARGAGGHPASPRADRLVKRFGLGWPALTRCINDDDPGEAISLASKQRVRRLLTNSEVQSAIKTVAARLGTDHIGALDYERTRETINREMRRKHLHGRHLTPLPGLKTIRAKMLFHEAVASAGLKVTPQGRHAAMPRIQAVRLFIEHCGFLPRALDLQWFATYHRIQLIAEKHSPAHSLMLSTLRVEFTEQGRYWPTANRFKVIPPGWRDYAVLPSPAFAAAHAEFPVARYDGLTLDEAKAAIHRAFDLLQGRHRLTLTRYEMLAQEHGGLPRRKGLHETAKRHDLTLGRLIRQVAAERAQSRN